MINKHPIHTNNTDISNTKVAIPHTVFNIWIIIFFFFTGAKAKPIWIKQIKWKCYPYHSYEQSITAAALTTYALYTSLYNE